MGILEVISRDKRKGAKQFKDSMCTKYTNNYIFHLNQQLLMQFFYLQTWSDA